RFQSFERKENQYAFEIRASAGPETKPYCMDVSVEAALETGSASKSDRFSLDAVHTVPSGLKKEQLGNRKVRISIPTFSAETQIKITGVTEKIAPEVFAISEGLLKALPVKATDPHETAGEPAGEDTND